MEDVNTLDKGFNVNKLIGLFYSILKNFEINTYAKQVGIVNYINAMLGEGEYVKNNRIILATYLVREYKSRDIVYSIVNNFRREIDNLFELLRISIKINTLNRLGNVDSIVGLINEIEDANLSDYHKSELIKMLDILNKLRLQSGMLSAEVIELFANYKEENNKSEDYRTSTCTQNPYNPFDIVDEVNKDRKVKSEEKDSTSKDTSYNTELFKEKTKELEKTLTKNTRDLIEVIECSVDEFLFKLKHN